MSVKKKPLSVAWLTADEASDMAREAWEVAFRVTGSRTSAQDKDPDGNVNAAAAKQMVPVMSALFAQQLYRLGVDRGVFTDGDWDAVFDVSAFGGAP